MVKIKEIQSFIQKKSGASGTESGASNSLELYTKILEGLKEIKEFGGIDQEHEMYEILKEIAILPSREKLDSLRKIRKECCSSYMLPEKIRFTIFKMVSQLINKRKVRILNPFSGTGSLIDEFVLEYKDAQIITEEINEKEAELQKEVFEVSGLGNIEVKNVDSLLQYNNDNKYDLIISNPPIGLKVAKNSIVLNGFDKNRFSKLTASSAFILKSIEKIDEEGIVVGILSPKILWGRKNKEIRDVILRLMDILAIIETPRRVIDNTKSNLVIMILRRKGSSSNSHPKNILMASFKETKPESDEFDKELDNLVLEWEEFLKEEV